MSEFTNLRTFSAMFTAPYAYLVFNWFEHACPEPWTIETITLDLLTCGEQSHAIYRAPFLVLSPRFDWCDFNWLKFDSMLVSRAWVVFGERFLGYVTLTVPDNIAWEKRCHFRQAMREALPKAWEKGMIRFGLRHLEMLPRKGYLANLSCNCLRDLPQLSTR
ncbi:hypothetical protein DL96DRAFT_1621854 [Flagelloscypha sp. PMI_526]|nr:hypothetical protein DL96DRAFT_1621854 [Flagelloscypha sp. PMI_526]